MAIYSISPLGEEPTADPVREALRYVENAKDLLIEKGRLDVETQLYHDRKYVRMAGNTLWNGILLILDAVFHIKNAKRRHPDINDYRKGVSKRDRKLLDLVNAAYETIHISMGYDGELGKGVSAEGIRLANDIIDRCATMLINVA